MNRPCCARTCPAPPQVRQVLAVVPGFADPPRLARLRTLDVELGGLAGERLVQAQLEVIAKVVAAIGGLAPPATASATHEIAEDTLEDVGKRAEVLRSRPAAALLEGGLATSRS